MMLLKETDEPQRVLRFSKTVGRICQKKEMCELSGVCKGNDVTWQQPAPSWGALLLTDRGRQSSLSPVTFTAYEGGL